MVLRFLLYSSTYSSFSIAPHGGAAWRRRPCRHLFPSQFLFHPKLKPLFQNKSRGIHAVIDLSRPPVDAISQGLDLSTTTWSHSSSPKRSVLSLLQRFRCVPSRCTRNTPIFSASHKPGVLPSSSLSSSLIKFCCVESVHGLTATVGLARGSVLRVFLSIPA